MNWPNDKKFAFTIFDDTDRSTLVNAPPIYAFLNDLGFKTTKSVWPIAGSGPAMIPGDTCEDKEYLAWVLQLQKQGFEIGLHNASYCTSDRKETIRAFDAFKAMFGHDPYTAANHASNEEAIYWGRARLSGPQAIAYDILRGFPPRNRFRGHVESDALFWGDICRDRVRYVRNFVFNNINTLLRTPTLPYYDPDRPFVNLWFSSSEGATVDSFCDTIEEKFQAQLENQGGACIMYTHFGKGFFEDGQLNPRFEKLMTSLAGRDGWFPTTAELLDYLHAANPECTLTRSDRAKIERRWLFDKTVRGVRSFLA